MQSTLKDAVDESRVMERGGRFLLPIKPTFKNGIGIVHDSSRSGRTIYVEPAAVVEPTNELQLLRSNLAREERRIMTEMSRLLSKYRGSIQDSVYAAAGIDLTCARFKLGQKLGGAIPYVCDDGVIDLEEFRHPALLLKIGTVPAMTEVSQLRGGNAGNSIVSRRRRGLLEASATISKITNDFDGETKRDGPEKLHEIVGNDLSLNTTVPGLVLTGPNAGGKTIVLKSLGLAALFVRSGIPVPCRLGSHPRVDFFETILADIGDMQSASGDLSTFSGHLLVCKTVLEKASEAAKASSLILMDELGSGTDPAQGVSIAQSVLESLLATGSRVAITTHYLQLKELANFDGRFQVAGMEFVDGRPTYRLKYGLVGESYALQVAERLGLPNEVILRARDLLDENVRRVSELIQELEEQRDQASRKEKELDGLTVMMRQKEVDAQLKLDEAEAEYADARAKAAEEYLIKIAETEERMTLLFEEIKTLKSAELEKVTGDSLSKIRLIYKDVAEDADTTPSLDLTPLTNADILEQGDCLVVLRRGMWFGVEGNVVKSSRNQVEIMVSGTPIKLKKSEVARASASVQEVPAVRKPRTAAAAAAKAAADDRRKLTASGGIGVSKRTQAYAGEAITPASRSKASTSKASGVQSKSSSSLPMRFEKTTLDLRGCTLDESITKIQVFVSDMNISGNKYVYLLHGHGTGKLKSGLRNWLKSGEMKSVKRHRPASSANGGDAFTELELK